MESAHLQIAGTLVAHQTADTLLHLARRLVGERQRQNLPRLDALLQKIGYLIGQHTRLSRAGTGNDQRRPVAEENRLALTFVQRGQESIVFHHVCADFRAKVQQ